MITINPSFKELLTEYKCIKCYQKTKTKTNENTKKKPTHICKWLFKNVETSHTHNFKNSALSVKSDLIITVLSIKKEFKTTDKTK